MHSYNNNMNKLLVILLISVKILAQDEWFFRDMLKGDVVVPPVEYSRQHYFSEAKNIALDITGDGRTEFLRFQIIDGKNYLKVYNDKKELLIEQKLEIKGYDAKPYKIIKKHLSKNIIATMIVFFEGKTGYLEKQGTSALYATVIEDGNLEHLKFKKIASVWLEHEKLDNYVRRPYNINFEDINLDGRLELVVNSGIVRKIFFYQSHNTWLY